MVFFFGSHSPLESIPKEIALSVIAIMELFTIAGLDDFRIEKPVLFQINNISSLTVFFSGRNSDT